MQSHKPLQEQAYENMIEMIFSGTLQPGEIYSETKIASMMGISRTPLKNALVYLSQDKYIDILPSKGFCLHRMTEQDILETCHMRSALEGYCARMLANDMPSPTAKAYLHDLKQQLDKVQKIYNTTKNFKTFTELDHEFHKMIVAYAKNEEFDQTFHHHMYRIRKFAKESFSKKGRMEEALVEHARIIGAIESGNGARTYEVVLEHINELTTIALAQHRQGETRLA